MLINKGADINHVKEVCDAVFVHAESLTLHLYIHCICLHVVVDMHIQCMIHSYLCIFRCCFNLYYYRMGTPHYCQLVEEVIMM